MSNVQNHDLIHYVHMYVLCLYTRIIAATANQNSRHSRGGRYFPLAAPIQFLRKCNLAHQSN